ncbi:MAG: glycosyltransferase [Robiginitomaculum sp.]|nr:glycosyltransferase [Robiginitomaculum sp.]
MKISVITAVYNRRATIVDAMTSLQSQDYDNYEHIITDGGSTDGTLEEINKLSDHRTKMISGPDEGIYDALNKGIKRATGDIIGLMHSDDFFASDTVLSKISDAFNQSSIDGVYGDLQYVSATDPTNIIRHWKSGVFSQKKLARGWMPPHPTLYLRREVFDRLGLYDTSFKIAADYDAMLRWLGAGKIKLAYIPEVLVKMRVGGESNKSISKILQKSREDYRAIKSNNIGGYGTLAIKNLSKIKQFIGNNR